MAQPHPHAAPFNDATEGLPAGVTATSPQVGATYAESLQPEPPPWGRRGLILAGCAVLGIVIGVTGQRLTSGEDAPPAAAPEPTPSASATVVPAQVVPVSPKDSSFRSKAGIWESQSYATREFGNLKSGIGLRLDLGQARPLHSVTFTAKEGPLTVELRAGDTPATDGADYELVGKPVQADGATSLPATSGGSHQYWMIWVTRLSPSLQAKVAKPAALG